MMRVYFIAVACFLVASSTVFGQLDSTANCKSIFIRRPFLSNAEYSFDHVTWYPTMSFFNVGNYKKEFKSIFNNNLIEYSHIKRSEKKNIINIFLLSAAVFCSVPIINAQVLPDISSKSRMNLFYTGFAICGVCIYIDITGYFDLKKAAETHNKRIMDK
jgi:hypothetical protein